MVDIIHHDPREFERWISRLSPIERGRIADKLAMLAGGGSSLAMPNVRRLGEADTARLLSYGSKDTQRRDIARARRRR